MNGDDVMDLLYLRLREFGLNPQQGAIFASSGLYGPVSTSYLVKGERWKVSIHLHIGGNIVTLSLNYVPTDLTQKDFQIFQHTADMQEPFFVSELALFVNEVAAFMELPEEDREMEALFARSAAQYMAPGVYCHTILEGPYKGWQALLT